MLNPNTNLDERPAWAALLLFMVAGCHIASASMPCTLAAVSACHINMPHYPAATLPIRCLLHLLPCILDTWLQLEQVVIQHKC